MEIYDFQQSVQAHLLEDNRICYLMFQALSIATGSSETYPQFCLRASVHCISLHCDYLPASVLLAAASEEVLELLCLEIRSKRMPA